MLKREILSKKIDKQNKTSNYLIKKEVSTTITLLPQNLM